MQKIKRRSWLIYRLWLVTPEKTNIFYPFPAGIFEFGGSHVSSLPWRVSGHPIKRQEPYAVWPMSSPPCYRCPGGGRRKWNTVLGSYVWNMVKPQLPCEDVSVFPVFAATCCVSYLLFTWIWKETSVVLIVNPVILWLNSQAAEAATTWLMIEKFRLGTFLETLISRRIHVWYIHLHLP